MHSEVECKALTRRRNCGGPHRSDSRHRQARPRKDGPVTKEQLAAIRRVEQERYADFARVKAAYKKDEEARNASAKDVSMAEGSGFGILETEEEV